jgi:hypothetical protein
MSSTSNCYQTIYDMTTVSLIRALNPLAGPAMAGGLIEQVLAHTGWTGQVAIDP